MTEEKPHCLRFPIGEFLFSEESNVKGIEDRWISTSEEFPAEIIHLTSGLSSEEKGWKYRPDGWSIKQVVHHCADSHMNAFIRIKKALTEIEPTISGYQEAMWAELIDSTDDDLSSSISIL